MSKLNEPEPKCPPRIGLISLADILTRGVYWETIAMFGTPIDLDIAAQDDVLTPYDGPISWQGRQWPHAALDADYRH